MSLRDLVADTFNTLWSHKVRTALTMFGIAWGIVSIMLMVGAGEGLRQGQAKVSAQLGKDLMIVFAGRTSLQAGGLRAGRLILWNAEDHAVVAADAPACDLVLPELGQSGLRIVSPWNNASLRVTGSLPPFAYLRSIDVGEGRFYNWDDQQHARRVAVLGSEAREQLFGTRPALGERLSIGGLPYTVVGVMRKKEQDSSYDGMDVQKVFVPFSTILRDFPDEPPRPPTAVDRLLVAPRSFPEHEACKSQVQRSLARLHGFDPSDEEACGIWDTVEEAKAFHMMSDGMKYFLGAVGVVTLLVGGIGVMNVMLVAVRERTREIGIRKALGAPARSILRQFFLESLLVVFASGGLGMAFAFGLAGLVNQAVMPPFFAGLLISWRVGLVAFLLLGTVAVLAAIYPASRAARIDPIEALRYEAGG